jgi:hypothetical protein
MKLLRWNNNEDGIRKSFVGFVNNLWDFFLRWIEFVGDFGWILMNYLDLVSWIGLVKATEAWKLRSRLSYNQSTINQRTIIDIWTTFNFKISLRLDTLFKSVSWSPTCGFIWLHSCLLITIAISVRCHDIIFNKNTTRLVLVY